MRRKNTFHQANIESEVMYFQYIQVFLYFRYIHGQKDEFKRVLARENAGNGAGRWCGLWCRGI